MPCSAVHKHFQLIANSLLFEIGKVFSKLPGENQIEIFNWKKWKLNRRVSAFPSKVFSIIVIIGLTNFQII